MGRTKQYADRVNVIKRVKVDGKWPFAPVVEKNGKIVRDHVWIAGRDEHHPEGRYYLEWYQDAKRRRQAVGGFDHAMEAARRKSIEIHASRAGVVRPEVIVADNPIPIGEAIDRYLGFVRQSHSPRTYLAYRYTLDTLLRQSYRKAFVDQVGREDILQFIANCYKRGLGNRTVYDKLVVALQLFKHHGKTKLIASSDWPNYIERIRPIYEAEEIEILLHNAEGVEGIFIKFLLGSGFRDGEVRHLTWRDIDFRNSLARVTAKCLWGFRPKNWEERAVPLPSVLTDQLQRLRSDRNGLPAQLVFPNSRGNPDSENDMIVKRAAQRAKLNCGQCVTKHGNKCAEGPHCQNFFLHKFRHTFATEHLRHGVDIRTLQTWMGHRDIKSTMVYLKGIHSKEALAKVNAGALAQYVR